MKGSSMYNPKNVGVVFIAMGALLFFMVAGQLGIKLLFIFLSLICVDYGLRLMGRPPLFTSVQHWFDALRS